MKSMNMYGTYLFRKKKKGYILYSKNINASHICPPKRKNVETETNGIKVFGKLWTLTCKTMVKVILLMKT